VRTLVLLDDTQACSAIQLELAASFHTGSVGHELLGGFECSRPTDKFVQDVALLAPVDLLDSRRASRQPPPATIPAFGLAGDSHSLVLAPYLVDRLSRSPSSGRPSWAARLDTPGLRGPALGHEPGRQRS
jgi:hypothetical protein